MKRLSNAKVGEVVRVLKVEGDAKLKKRLLDMGIISGTEIRVVRNAPLKDPVEFELRGYKLSLRKNEAEFVLVE
ncbi:MAG: ferrous iron transport protein A [Candidatus Hydrothermarchaeota archaeon]|nr:MAG: ferrous iron transport protein A [Candidatus Hydrothermarchaeota archaeon]RLG59899.1 MAG: ferrous iron transport protein A [Candidatus Hydrothermarchaeota archaeon]